MLEFLNGILRAVAKGLRIPGLIILILLMAATVLLLGAVVVEAFTHRKAFTILRKKLLDEVSRSEPSKQGTIAERLIKEERAKRAKIIAITDLIIKLGPMFGLLGTLIPLGPGLVAFGRGDTYTLSLSLLEAFDTTIAGLISGGVCLVISKVRSTWYERHLTLLRNEMEDLLDEAEAE